MLNILSTTEKKKVIIEYRLRLAVVSVVAVGALVVASIVLLAPSYLLAVTKFTDAEKTLAALEEKYGTNSQEKDISVQIRDINNKISLLLSSGTNTQLSPSQTIAKILNIKGSAIKLYGITYDGTTVQERFVLTGTAASRDSLATFVEDLKKEPTFTSVTLPISSYVKSTNIDFSIVVERISKIPAKK